MSSTGDHVGEVGARAGTTARRVTWGVVGVVVVVAAFFAARFDLPDTLPGSPLIGATAPDLDLPFLESEGSVPLHEPGSITVVNFWASWCPPCRAEHPDLVRAADALGTDGIRFVAIMSRDREAAAVAFLDELGRSDHQWVVTDPGNLAFIEFGVWGLPETYFIAEDGTIVGKVAGGLDLVTLLSMVEQVRAGDRVGDRTTGEVYQQAP